MIIDDTLVFSSNQAITGDAGSTNVIDLGATGTAPGAAAALTRDIGKSCGIAIDILVTEAFNSLTSLTIALQVDDNAGFSSAKTVATSAAIPLAALVAGFRPSFPSHVPEGTDERYLRLYYDVTGTNPSTGRISAAIVAGRQTA